MIIFRLLDLDKVHKIIQENAKLMLGKGLESFLELF